MRKLMKDSEAWAVLGETIKCSNHLSGGMLCSTLVQATRLKVLEPYQWLRMESQLYRHFFNKKKYRHLWPPHTVKQAVNVCYKLARLIEHEENSAG